MRSALLFAATLALSGPAFAQSTPSEQDHAAHHPEAASAPAGTPREAAQPAPGTPAAPTPGQVDAQMKSMCQMHDRMMAAKTPQERHALMAEHMKSMQGGMAMMKQMRGGEPAAGASGGMAMNMEMMSRRMDMMETMMQMMVDREAARARPRK